MIKLGIAIFFGAVIGMQLANKEYNIHLALNAGFFTIWGGWAIKEIVFDKERNEP